MGWARRQVTRPAGPVAFLLGALVLGLLAMHHVLAATPAAQSIPHAAAPHSASTPTASAHAVDAAQNPDTPAGHGDSHHVLNPCVAVLAAAPLLALALLSFGVPTNLIRIPRRRTHPTRSSGRGPPFLPTSARLASLCVLRV
ncbi:DUF6153 family protein [Rhodococcus kronopolitis]|uniref:DUF6153 family protein n=1 Tax=Rhodococcus kronopolitis TaxID=1460226 RepID=A0ABV9FVP6_9NOCA